MLISNKGPKNGDVVTIRLLSGDEVVGRLVADDGYDVVLNHPISAVMQATRTGEIGLAFAPFAASTDPDQDFAFPKPALAFRPIMTREDVKQGYEQATKPASAIIQPNKGIILPK